MDERRPVEASLTVAEVGAVRDVRHATARPVRVEQLRQHTGDPGAGQRQRADVGRVLGVEQRDGVAGREPVRPVVLVGAAVVALDDPGHRLLLQPLPCVTRGDAGPASDRTRRRPGWSARSW